MPSSRFHILRRGASFVAVLLLIEFLDELVFGAREAAWPLIRDDLGLSYAQVGILLGVPTVTSNLVEPFLAILGDVWRRRALVLGGGVAFAMALLLTAIGDSFLFLLFAFVLLYPASGAFVSLSQATLMDSDPARHEQNMARWTFAGSLGVVAGPLALAGAAASGLSWRGVFVIFAALTVILLLVAWQIPFPVARSASAAVEENAGTLLAGLRGAMQALRRREVLRWLVLLQFSDLMLDVLLGFLALYFVDAVGTSPAVAGTAVAVWSGAGLLGDFLLIPLLERVPGLRYLRFSVLAELVLFPGFLLAPGIASKLVLLALLGLFNAGWYAILQARLYSALPAQSGTALALGNVAGLAGALIPLGLGLVAETFGLAWSMWLLWLGPLALLVGLPRTGE